MLAGLALRSLDVCLLACWTRVRLCWYAPRSASPCSLDAGCARWTCARSLTGRVLARRGGVDPRTTLGSEGPQGKWTLGPQKGVGPKTTRGGLAPSTTKGVDPRTTQGGCGVDPRTTEGVDSLLIEALILGALVSAAARARRPFQRRRLPPRRRRHPRAHWPSSTGAHLEECFSGLSKGSPRRRLSRCRQAHAPRAESAW